MAALSLGDIASWSFSGRLRSPWALPPGVARPLPKPSQVALLGFEWVCAVLVFTCASAQRSGLWGPSLKDCTACNGPQATTCTSGPAGPHGLGCPYTAFGSFQLLCLAGVFSWIGTSALLALAYLGRGPPPMTDFLLYAGAGVVAAVATAAAAVTCAEQAIPGVPICTGAAATRAACWFGLFLSGGFLTSAFYSLASWRELHFSGAPVRVAAALNKLSALGGAPGGLGGEAAMKRDLRGEGGSFSGLPPGPEWAAAAEAAPGPPVSSYQSL